MSANKKFIHAQAIIEEPEVVNATLIVALVDLGPPEPKLPSSFM